MAGSVAEDARPVSPRERALSHHDHQPDRITRLEEASLFTDRRLDELHEEVLALSRLLEVLAVRVAALERARQADSQPPPDDATDLAEP